MAIYSGSVQEGSQKATELGFPTVNIAIDDPYISGSFAARVTVNGKTYDAVAYADQDRELLEAHIFDFAERIYDTSISIELLEKLREAEPEMEDELMRETIRGDVGKAKEYFAKQTK